MQPPLVASYTDINTRIHKAMVTIVCNELETQMEKCAKKHPKYKKVGNGIKK